MELNLQELVRSDSGIERSPLLDFARVCFQGMTNRSLNVIVWNIYLCEVSFQSESVNFF
jgi:hypothetical protein